MKRTFPATFQTTRDQFWKEACMTLPHKECHELYDSFDVVIIWRDLFKCRYGELTALTHYSNPDDPPDVVAHFSDGDLDIEHTIIDPSHVKEADALHRKLGGGARACMPISHKPANKEEMMDIMYAFDHPKAWENTSDALKARLTLILDRTQMKMEKYLPGGLLLLPGELFEFEQVTIEDAFNRVASLPNIDKWTVVTKSRWNSEEFYSALWSRQTGFTSILQNYGQPPFVK